MGVWGECGLLLRQSSGSGWGEPWMIKLMVGTLKGRDSRLHIWQEWEKRQTESVGQRRSKANKAQHSCEGECQSGGNSQPSEANHQWWNFSYQWGKRFLVERQRTGRERLFQGFVLTHTSCNNHLICFLLRQTQALLPIPFPSLEPLFCSTHSTASRGTGDTFCQPHCDKPKFLKKRESCLRWYDNEYISPFAVGRCWESHSEQNERRESVLDFSQLTRSPEWTWSSHQLT